MSTLLLIKSLLLGLPCYQFFFTNTKITISQNAFDRKRDLHMPEKKDFLAPKRNSWSNLSQQFYRVDKFSWFGLNVPHHEIVVNLRNKKLSLKVSRSLSFSVFNSFTAWANNKRIISEWGNMKKNESDTNLKIFQHTCNLPQP